MENDIFTFIKNEIDNNDIVVFMKGTDNFPLCGYSALVVNILKSFDVVFKGINVLENEELRQGIKDFSEWPTVPQVYIKGEFIGGSDIMKELHQNGDLKELLKEKNLIAV